MSDDKTIEIIRGWSGLPQAAQGAAVAIGNFDGVHLGHQTVLGAAMSAAQAWDLPVGAAVFDPHPRRYFQPDAPPFRLMSDRKRAETLAEMGLDRLYVLPFDADFRELSDEAFARDVLAGGLGAAHVAVGADFRFGKGRAGDADRLRELGERYGFRVTAVAPVGRGRPFSSTGVREALREGDCAGARAILGRPWIVDGEVLPGKKLGRTLGFPTANLELGDLLRPRFGIYAVRARLEGRGPWLPGAASIGVRPTVEGDGAAELLEVYLLDFEGDLYGQRMEVAFHAFLREEAKFDSADAMAEQMHKDVADCRAALETTGGGE